MSDSKPLIMVASLDRHLHKERSAVFEALMAQGCIPIGLPFPAVAANYLWKLNQIAINDADYIFLLIGREYGPLTEQGVGYLHQTYAAARALHKTVVSFIYTGDEKPILSDIDQTRLGELVAQSRAGLYYEWFNEETLRDNVEQAVEHLIEAYPQPGWCRAVDEPQENGNWKRCAPRWRSCSGRSIWRIPMNQPTSPCWTTPGRSGKPNSPARHSAKASSKCYPVICQCPGRPFLAG